MTNLLLTFPDLAPGDFRPWIDEAAARRDGKTPDEAAAAAAESWSSGLQGWGLAAADISALRAAAEFTIYTPGSAAGVPLNVLGSLAPPKAGADTEAYRDEIEGFVTGLLGLAGIEADPLASREHILLANLIEDAWAKGATLSLETPDRAGPPAPAAQAGGVRAGDLLSREGPPGPGAAPEQPGGLTLLRRLADRAAARHPVDAVDARRASRGRPSSTWPTSPTPSASSPSPWPCSRLVTWMRSQPGSSELRALVYMDEVFGFVPPTAVPPAKKPILTILKQARAFGVGMLLSTQNPVDLDYKAMSNAGTWCIGRLQTERDKARDHGGPPVGLGRARPGRRSTPASRAGQAPVPAAQHPRPRAGGSSPPAGRCPTCGGPLTRAEIERLTADDPLRAAAAAAAPAPGPPRRPAAPEGEHRVAAAPRVAAGTPVYYLDPAAPWAEQVGAKRGGTGLAAALAARVHLTFDDTAAGLRQVEEWEAVFHPLGEQFDPAAAVAVDYDRRDFLPEAPLGASYQLPAAPLHEKTFFSGVARDLKEHLARERTMEVLRNRALKLYSRVGEDRRPSPPVAGRAAEVGADAAAAKIRDRFEDRLDTLRDQIEEARFKVEQADLDSSSRRTEEMASGVGTLIGVLLGGRRSTGSLGTIASKRSMTKKAQQRRAGAEARLTDKVEDLEELERDLAEELAEIDAEWAATCRRSKRSTSPWRRATSPSTRWPSSGCRWPDGWAGHGTRGGPLSRSPARSPR